MERGLILLRDWIICYFGLPLPIAGVDGYV